MRISDGNREQIDSPDRWKAEHGIETKGGKVPAAAESHTRRPVSTALQERLTQTRKLSLSLAAPLSAEDQVVQASDDASPTKWHLAHTTWFFETFVCKPHLASYRPLDDRFAYCFNSYYEAAGPRHPRARRGMLTRPSLQEVHRYRAHVDDALARLFDEGVLQRHPLVADLIELGINHEQQHQELILTDILALFDAQPLRPAYQPAARHEPAASATQLLRWFDFSGGIHAIGHAGGSFAYDNECPRHNALLQDYRLADRLVTNGEWLDFMADGGYADPAHWLADGWAAVKANGWVAPGYWEGEKGEWRQMTLQGLLPVDLRAPVCHVSYYEADAFARWANKRLPTEFEWEACAAKLPVQGNMLGSGPMRPMPATGKPANAPAQMFGDVWEWTQSAYSPYPGYRAGPGALGEYNGKFMSNQYVLRGASCATPLGHSRATYRNFFYPHQRWQFTGVRLADDA
ncbi:MAG TPA: ergothioneine biosynthesis protein EgtB [Hyphomicrobiaceae bacterium]|nr:ergothioneine biosynthesis protein EgtB [Hyphomicrobiaceae bacterium]